MSGILDLSLAPTMQPVTSATVVLDLSVFGTVVQVRIKADVCTDSSATYSLVVYGDTRHELQNAQASAAMTFLRTWTPMTTNAAQTALSAAQRAAVALSMTPVI